MKKLVTEKDQLITRCGGKALNGICVSGFVKVEKLTRQLCVEVYHLKKEETKCACTGLLVCGNKRLIELEAFSAEALNKLAMSERRIKKLDTGWRRSARQRASKGKRCFVLDTDEAAFWSMLPTALSRVSKQGSHSGQGAVVDSAAESKTDAALATQVAILVKQVAAVLTWLKAVVTFRKL